MLHALIPEAGKVQDLPERSTVSCNMEEAGIAPVAERLGLSPATAHLAAQLAERAGGPEGDVPGFSSPAQVSTSAGCGDHPASPAGVPQSLACRTHIRAACGVLPWCSSRTEKAVPVPRPKAREHPNTCVWTPSLKHSASGELTGPPVLPDQGSSELVALQDTALGCGHRTSKQGLGGCRPGVA